MSERITITGDEFQQFAGGEYQQKGSALLRVLGPGGRCSQWDGDVTVGRDFQVLVERFMSITETTDSLAGKEIEDECSALLSEMTEQLRDEGYEVVFQ